MEEDEQHIQNENNHNEFFAKYRNIYNNLKKLMKISLLLMVFSVQKAYSKHPARLSTNIRHLHAHNRVQPRNGHFDFLLV